MTRRTLLSLHTIDDRRIKTQKRPSQFITETAFNLNSGNYLLSHTVARAVPSAQEGLTSVFGMGTGGSPPILSPENFYNS